jgi:hypothetical protein
VTLCNRICLSAFTLERQLLKKYHIVSTHNERFAIFLREWQFWNLELIAEIGFDPTSVRLHSSSEEGILPTALFFLIHTI